MAYVFKVGAQRWEVNVVSNDQRTHRQTGFERPENWRAQVFPTIEKHEVDQSGNIVQSRHGITEQNRNVIAEAGFGQIGASGKDLGSA
jgi:hypothetical protein